MATKSTNDMGLTIPAANKAAHATHGNTHDPEDSTDVTIDELENNEIQESTATSSFSADPRAYYATVDRLPNIIVTRITLDRIGGDIIPEINPHVDDIDGAIITYDDFGNPEFVGKSIDYLSKTRSSSALLVKIEMVIKEVLNIAGIGTWYDNELLLKYMNMRVVLSNKEKFTDEIRNGVYAPDPKEYAESEHKKYATENIIDISKSLRKNIKEYDYTLDEDGNVIYDVAFETSFILKNINPEHIAIFVCTYIDVDQIVADFGCGAGNIKALGIKGKIGPIMGERIINKYEVDNRGYVYLTPENKLWTGPVNQTATGYNAVIRTGPGTAIVIDLRRVPIKNQKINDLRRVKSAELIDIEFSVIENKLLNLSLGVLERNIVDFERIDEYFSQVYGARDKRGQFRAMFGFNYQKFLRDKTEYGKLLENRNLAVVKSIVDACTLSFMKISRARVEDLDHLNALGSVIKGRIPFGSNKVSTIIHEMPKDIIVYGTEGPDGRIKPSHRMVDEEGKVVPMGTRSDGKVRRSGHLREIDIYPVIDGNIKHYSLADYSIGKATDGLYRYEVEIVMEDGTRPYLKRLASRLRLAKKALLGYHNEAIRKTNGVSNYNSTNKKFSQRFINQKNGQYPVPKNRRIRGRTLVTYLGQTKEKDPGDIGKHEHSFVTDLNGNGRTNIVNDHYHKIGNFAIGQAVLATTKQDRLIQGSHIHAAKILGNRASAPWIKPIAEYLEILDIITCGIHSVNIAKFSTMANKMMKPETGSPEGIMRIAKLIEDLHDKVRNMVGVPKSVANRSDAKKIPTERRRVRFTKKFDYIFDSNVEKLTGYDYIVGSAAKPVDKGLFMITGKEYVERVKEETRKYFCVEQVANINLVHGGKEYINNDDIYNSELSYLSPASADVGGYTVSLLEDCDFVKQQDTLFELEARVMDFIVTGTPQADTPTQDTLESLVYANLESVLNLRNVIVYDIAESDAGVRAGTLPTTVARCIENVKTYFGGLQANMIAQNMVTQDLTNSDVGTSPLGFSIEFKKENNVALSSVTAAFKSSSMLVQRKINIKDYDLGNEYNVLEDFPTIDFYPLPNQVKSLFLKRSAVYGLDESKEEPKKDSVLRFNFQLLKMIEVFLGYEKVDYGAGLIKRPIWTRITYDLFNQAVGQTLLCRLVSYSDPRLNIRYRREIELPVYNEHFLLSPTEAIPVKPSKGSNFGFPDIRREAMTATRNLADDVLLSLAEKAFEQDKVNSNMLVVQVPGAGLTITDADGNTGPNKKGKKAGKKRNKKRGERPGSGREKEDDGSSMSTGGGRPAWFGGDY